MKEAIKKFLINVVTAKSQNQLKLKAFQVIKIFLILLSFVYILCLKILIFLYKTNLLKKTRVDCAVISIGNISMGGTGKTPFLIYLGRKLEETGSKFSVVCRGYAEDEIKEVKSHFPSVNIFAGRDRSAGMKQAVRHGNPRYILLDDGFQHWRVNRDVDIITLDASKDFEKERVLPAGFLREPVSHIKRADIIILTRVDLVSPERVREIKQLLMKIKPDVNIFEVYFGPESFCDAKAEKIIPIENFKKKSVGVFCGIGNNEAFAQTLEKLDIKVASRIFFLDHHKYDPNDLDLISKDAEDKKLGIYITTFKDILKIPVDKLRIEVYCLKIKARFKDLGDEDRFFKLIRNYTNG